MPSHTHPSHAVAFVVCSARLLTQSAGRDARLKARRNEAHTDKGSACVMSLTAGGSAGGAVESMGDL